MLCTSGWHDISEDEYYLLRENQLDRAQLTEITIGDEEAFAEGTPQEILEGISQSIREADLKELARGREKCEEAQRQLQLEQAIEIGKCVYKGLEFAHSKGIIHRDLKPGNV